MDEIKIGSNRGFGIVFFVVFLLIAIYPLLKGSDLRIWSLIISFIFLALGLTKSNLLTPLNILWFKFGLFLGKIISPLIMGFIFFRNYWIAKIYSPWSWRDFTKALYRTALSF